MDKKLLVGVAVGIALAGVGVAVLNDSADAAPFQQVVTRQAAQARVFQVEVVRSALPDGGDAYAVNVHAVVPETRTLPDGGTGVRNSTIGSSCVASGAVATALANAFAGAFLSCVRASDDLEQ